LKGVFDVGRSRGSRSRDKNKSSLPQVPKNMKYDRMSEEFAAELNNSVSLEEQAWANATNQRVQGNKNK
jgi:YfhD-like protein